MGNNGNGAVINGNAFHGKGSGIKWRRRQRRPRKRLRVAWPGFGRGKLQPSASIAYKGFSLGAWGSVGIESSDTKEFDLILGYSTGGFSVSVTELLVQCEPEMG